jgi:hypothetical protein
MQAAVERRFEIEDPSPQELGELRGEWIAVLGKKILAHGSNPEQVLDEAEKLAPPGRHPMIYRVPTGEVMLL